MTKQQINRKGIVNLILSTVVAIAFFSLLTSCDITKEAFKEKDNSSGKESSEVITKRKGDTVSYVVPVIRYKDTTIYTTNRQGTVLRTVYDQNGQISNIDCFASAIEEIKRENREFQNALKSKQKEKTESANFDWVIYIVVGICFIVLVALILAFIWLKQQNVVIKNIAERI